MLGFVKRQAERGDTLIEVLFAVTVFASIVVVALSLMNQGVAASQRSLEITTVRQQMDGQAETLRFLHEAYVQAYQPGVSFTTPETVNTPAAEYYRLIQYIAAGNRTSASQFDGTAACAIPSDASKDFVLDPVAAKYKTAAIKAGAFGKATTYAQLVYDKGAFAQSQGMWVEAVRSGTNGTNAGYIDFHIRACWDVLGSDVPMNLGTIVRLYEPRG
jgi:type II secretory pathway pseudopilin PulG